MSGKDTGLSAWVRLRMSAIALVPLTFWAVYSILELKGLPYSHFVQWMENPYNSSMLIVFLLLTYYHGALGVQEIYEDYITCEKTRKLVILVTRLAFLVLTVLSCVSIASIAY